MTDHADHAFEGWLKTATRRLPREMSEMARAELEAHYADAVQDYKRQGYPADEGRRAALADLGDAAETGRALRAAHTGVGRVLLAMALALVYPFSYAFVWSYIERLTGSEVVGSIVWNLVVFWPTLCVLLTFKRVLAQRHGAGPFERPLRFVLWGLGVDTHAAILALLIYGVPAATQTGEHRLFEAAPLLLTLLDWLALAGVAAVGAGLLGLARALRRLDRGSLWGLRIPLWAAILLDGIAALGYVLSILVLPLLDNVLLVMVLSLLIYLFHTVIFMLLTLLFFRSIYRSRTDPLQTA